MPKYTCPAALNIAGEHFPCQQMEQMAEGSEGHDGWAHSNRDAEAIWASGIDPVPGMPGWETFAKTTVVGLTEDEKSALDNTIRDVIGRSYGVAAICRQVERILAGRLAAARLLEKDN